MAGNDVTWLRPATDIETLFIQFQEEAGILVSTYGLTIRTTQPLKNEHVQEALVHLYRLVSVSSFHQHVQQTSRTPIC